MCVHARTAAKCYLASSSKPPSSPSDDTGGSAATPNRASRRSIESHALRIVSLSSSPPFAFELRQDVLTGGEQLD